MRRPALALLLGCLLLVAGASALDGYDYYQTIEYAGCDQEIYQQDIVIHRSTGTAYNETAGGLETWHIFVGEHCREDYGDVRFTNSTGAELAYYLWPDFTSESARFAVQLEGADAAGEVTIWYGNPSATTTSNGDATFSYFDQFDGSALDTTKWTLAPRAIATVADGQLSLKGTYSSGLDGICGKTFFDTSKYQVQWGVVSGEVYAYAHWGWGSDAAHGSATNDIAFRWARTTKQVGLVKSGAWYSIDYAWPSTPGEYRVARSGSTALFMSSAGVHSINDAAKVTTVDLAPRAALSLSTSPIVIDYVLVRAYSAAPPAATTFSGEHETAAPPVTAFTTTPLAGLAPLTVQFTDASTGHPTSWLWSFGDGNTSTAQNPQHTYTAPGTYSVTLTATNEYGSTPATKLDYITVYGPITAQLSATPTGGTAPLTVQFTDRSTGGPTTWSWNFGDGNTSTAQNPQHTYITAGAHTVTLTASHPYSSDTETKTAYIIVAVLQPFPGLTLIPRDLTGNGLYTDINGNNRLDYNDLTIFFQNLAWAKTAQPIACFDFNGNGWLDYNDVITLFSTIMEEHT